MFPFLTIIPLAEVGAVVTAVAGTVVSALAMWRTKSAFDHLSRELSQDLMKIKLTLDQEPANNSSSEEQRFRFIEQELQNALLRLDKDERDIVEETLQNSSVLGKRRILSNLIEREFRQHAT